MFVGCFEISISVIVKHVGSKLVKQVLVLSEIFVCLGGPVKIFSAWEGGGGAEEITRLLFARGEISTLADTTYRCDEDWLIFWQQS